MLFAPYSLGDRIQRTGGRWVNLRRRWREAFDDRRIFSRLDPTTERPVPRLGIDGGKGAKRYSTYRVIARGA